MKGQMLPVIYRQARAILAIHGADRQVVEAELAPLGLRPLLLHKERALVSLGWFDYVDSSIGPYRELVVATPALPRSGRWTFARFALNGAIPNFILDLPVTSELACTLGRELYGFPKWLAQISMTGTSQETRAELAYHDRTVLCMTFVHRVAVRVPTPNWVLFSNVHNSRHQVRLVLCGVTKLMLKPRISWELKSAEHPTSHLLRKLRLTSSPLFGVIIDPFRTSLGFPRRA